MKIFVINLKRSEARRKKIEAQLKKYNLDYEIFEAVDGYNLTDEQIATHVDPNNKYVYPFKSAEVGCFLSHYSIYNKIKELNIPVALILEDDVNLSPNLSGLLPSIEKLIQNNKSVISLYTIFPGGSELSIAQVIDNNYSLFNPIKVEVDAGAPISGASAYVITNKAATALAEKLLPMYTVVDDWGFYLLEKYIDTYQVVFPHPVDITDTYSDIHESYGGAMLKIRKFIVNNIPLLGDVILNKRKKHRQLLRKGNILLDGKSPDMLFK